jgi:adenosylhomocysteine nucleosidase
MRPLAGRAWPRPARPERYINRAPYAERTKHDLGNRRSLEGAADAMKILITFAVPAEFSAWRRHHDFRQVARDPFALYFTEIGGSPTRVLLTGVGARAAEQAVRWALETPADLCISSGFAGALRSDLKVGNVLAARVVRRAEKELAVASDQELLGAACNVGARHVERFLTSERLVVSAAEKALLASEAEAVEMESFVILAEAARRGVRAVAVRATSDNVAASLPCNFDRALDDRGRICVSAILAAVARRPQRIPGLLRLARDCRIAAQQLAEFMDDYLSLLNVRMDLSQSEMVAAT